MLRTKDEGIESIGLTGYKLAALGAKYLPEPLMSGLAAAVGIGAAQAMRQRRTVVSRNLTRIDPALRGARLERAIRATFDSYARYWVESFRLPYLSNAEVDAGFAFDGYGQIPLALREGKGAILALPHLGGWEWAGRWMVDRGHKLTVVVEPIEPPELFEFFVEFRRSLGMEIIGLGTGAGSQVVRALNDNHVVCLVCDRDIQGGGIDVEFFGEKTTMPAGPATMAFRTGAPIFPTAVYFTSRRNGHLARVCPPLSMERTGRLRDDIARATQDLTWALEELIRHAPDQWHMMQPNWPADADLSE
jgi:KDO2-lipid IV(A) lauroyltransferase